MSCRLCHSRDPGIRTGAGVELTPYTQHRSLWPRFKNFKFRFINLAFCCIFLLPIILFHGWWDGISNVANELCPTNSRCFMPKNFLAPPGHASPENFEN